MPDSTNAPEISVILPVHNAESKLEACLDALLAQSAQSMEIIAIDDGSTDSSGAILDAYASKDPRLVVIHQANAGVWTARLAVIEKARGQWFAACDADDIPHPTLLATLLASAQANHAQMAVCSYRRIDSRTGEPLAVEMTPRAATVKPREDPVGFAGINTALWNKLFRMDVVTSSLVFRDPPETMGKPRLMEDMVLIASMLGGIETVSFVDEALYDYFVHPASSMKTLVTHDVATVAEWMAWIRAGVDDKVRASLDVMAFVHLGASAMDNLMRTASAGQLKDYTRWVARTLKRDFPWYMARARAANGVILRLRVARRLFRMGCLLPGMRMVGLFARLTKTEVKW